MWIVADREGVKIINCIGLEDYVESVLRTETWPGWPLEVNKVCAIASRTYVIAMVQRAKNSKCLYHVRNTNKHQTYTGGNASDVIKQAVKETEGVFITYNNQPITAMFDACCGGVVTSRMAGVDFAKAPYLARSYPCEFCKNCKGYSWQARYALHDFVTTLKKNGIHVRKVRDIKVSKKDRAGIVQEVIVKGATHNHHVSGKKIYSLFNKNVKSFYFTVEKSGDFVLFKGRGQGHHLGLCQWGAREMVRDGVDYKSVLSFYYPGTKLMRLA
jgi:stage II sporulation protein D